LRTVQIEAKAEHDSINLSDRFLLLSLACPP
jgi:hypothetical protein